MKDKELHYTTKIFEVIKNYDANTDNLFSEHELKELSKALYNHYLSLYNKSDKKCSLPVYIGASLYFLKKMLLKGKLINYYVTYVGKTNKICDYLINKYFYINKKYVNNYNKFKEIINNVLSLPNLIRRNIQNNITKEAIYYHKNVINEKINVSLDAFKKDPEARKLLLEKYGFYIDKYKTKYKYYDNNEIVKNNLNKFFNRSVNAYLNGSSKKRPSNYLATIIPQRFENYQNFTIKEKYFANIILIVNDYLDVLDVVYENNNLTPTQKGNLEEYMNLMLEEYIENGNYKDNKKYFINMINNYNDIQKRYSYEKRKNG